jgi:hypothetical protein
MVERGRGSSSAASIPASSSIEVDEGGGGEGVEIEGEGGGQGDDTDLFAREIARVWVALGGRAPSLNSADTSEKTENEGKKVGEEIKPRLHVDTRRAAGIVRGALGAAGGVGGGEFFYFFRLLFLLRVFLVLHLLALPRFRSAVSLHGAPELSFALYSPATL